MLLAINATSGWDSVSSFSRIGKRKHSRHLKRKLMSWQRYVWLWWVPITLFGMLFRGCQYPVRLFSAPGEQSNFKNQWIAMLNIYRRMSLEIDYLHLCHAEWTIKHLFGSQHMCQYWTYHPQLEMHFKWKVWCSVKSSY